MHRSTRAVLAVVSVSLGLSYLAQRPTQAYPKFMKKEGLTSCGYCHTKENGGGARNYRGNFYGAHENSFAGFDDAAEAKKAGVDVGPHADMKPASQTPPAAPPPVAPPPPAEPPVAPPPVAPPPAKSPLMTAVAQEKAAKAAYMKSKTPKMKTAYMAAIKKVLALDPKNAMAKADMKAVGAK